MTRRTVDILFDGPPGPESGRFIEVEDSETRASVNVGTWIQQPTNDHPDWWALRLEVCDGEPHVVPSQAEMSRFFAEAHLFTRQFDEMPVSEFRTMCDNLARSFLELLAGKDPAKESNT